MSLYDYNGNEVQTNSENLVKKIDHKLEFGLAYKSTTIPVITITNADYTTKYDYLYFIIEHYADYAFNASLTSLNGTSKNGLWSSAIVEINDKKYYLLTIDCSAIQTDLNGAAFESLEIVATNVSARWSGTEKAWLSSEYSEELVLRDFISVEITDTFVMAVDDALEATDSISELNGKIVIFMGDSYTKGAISQFEALCEKYGATADNYGIVSSSITGDESGNHGFQPMHIRTKTVCETYVDNGNTGDVGAIVFMGGANDGIGSSTWLGSGINDLNTNHIYGAMHSILNDFRTTFDCPIFVILQPTFPNGDTSNQIDDNETAILWGFENAEQCKSFDSDRWCQYKMYKKQTIVKQMAEYYNCNIVDCFFNYDISIFRPTDRAKYWSSDGHPTPKGYQHITDNLEKTMLSYDW